MSGHNWDRENNAGAEFPLRPTYAKKRTPYHTTGQF